MRILFWKGLLRPSVLDPSVRENLAAQPGDADLAVFALRVGGLRGGAALLKTLREAGNLEPGTGVAVEVDLGDGL